MSVHAKKTENGLRFRVWSGCCDSYMTPEMNESQVLRWLVEYRLERAIGSVSEVFDQVARASKHGTSSRIDQRDLVAWESELPEDQTTFRDEGGGEATLIHADPEKYITDECTELLTRWREDHPRIDGKRVQVTFKVTLVDDESTE